MNRFLKPVLAGAAMLTVAVPALASAHVYDRGDAYAYANRGDYGYRGDFARSDRHERWGGDYGRHDSWRYRFSRHHRHQGRDGRFEGGWR